MHIHVYEATIIGKLKSMMNSGIRRAQGFSGYMGNRKQINLMIKDAQGICLLHLKFQLFPFG